MALTILQALLIVFALFALSRVILRFKDKEITVGELVFWGILWIAVVVIALLPPLTGIISGFLGVGRGMDLVVYSSIVVLFYLMFRLYVRIEKMEQNISKIVEKVALLKKK